MDKYLRVCLTESEVDERMTKWHPHVEDYYVERALLLSQSAQHFKYIPAQRKDIFKSV